MAAPTLLVSALLALGTGAGFAAVAAVIRNREHSGRGRGALTMFVLFWVSAAVVWITQGLSSLAGSLGATDMAVHEALDQVTTPFYCLAAAGLLYYVLYPLTGRERLLVPILAWYGLLYVLLRWRVEAADRIGVRVEDWYVGFDYATPLQGPSYTALIALVSGPLLLAILAYGTIGFRVTDRGVRYRVALVTAGLLAWVGTEALSFATGFASTDAGEVTRRIVALLSTIVILMAYRPPAGARRWIDAAAAEKA